MGSNVFSQDIFSPLSTQGVGQLRSKSFVHNLGMGGIGTAYTDLDSLSYSLKNPATSSYIKYTSFDFGVNMGLNQVVGVEEANRGTFDDFGLNYMSVAMLLNKKKGWTVSFGISPFSAFGYNDAESYYDSLKIEEHLFEGGLSQTYLNTAFRLFGNRDKVKNIIDKNANFRQKKIDSIIRVPRTQILTAGLQGTYLFGSKSYEHNIYFPKEPDLAAVNTVNNYLIRGFTYKLGLHYKIKDITFKTNKTTKNGTSKEVMQKIDFDLGLYASSSANNSALLERYATSFFIQGGSSSVPDTVLPKGTSKGNFKLPNSLGAGFMFTKKDNWRIGFDVDYTQWSKFDYSGLTSTLNDELNLSLGGGYKVKDGESFLGRMEYRAGLNYRQSFLNQNSKQLNGYSTTFGIGMPFGKTIKSNLNLGFELGTLGNRADHLFEERYYNFYLGITVNEFWFQKQREK